MENGASSIREPSQRCRLGSALRAYDSVFKDRAEGEPSRKRDANPKGLRPLRQPISLPNARIFHPPRSEAGFERVLSPYQPVKEPTPRKKKPDKAGFPQFSMRVNRWANPPEAWRKPPCRRLVEPRFSTAFPGARGGRITVGAREVQERHEGVKVFFLCRMHPSSA